MMVEEEGSIRQRQRDKERRTCCDKEEKQQKVVVQGVGMTEEAKNAILSREIYLLRECVLRPYLGEI